LNDDRLLVRYGLAGSSNTTGDDQKKLDILSNELFINMLKSSYTVYAMASEENENLIEVEIPKQVGMKINLN
jgi:fructose-1,6-bisphosphatase I